VDGLPALEAYFDAASKDLRGKESIDSLVVSCGRYLGEAVRLRCGGKWKLPLTDERDVNYNTPVIAGHTPQTSSFHPSR
jgi:hypothetical protein